MSNAAAPRSTVPDERLYEIDLLRFVAAVLVLLHHFVGRIAGWGPEGYPDLGGVLPHVTQYGFLGVDLFFVISGFVILMSSWGRPVGDYAVSRVVRILPAYWFAVTLALGLYMTTGHVWIRPGDDPDLSLLVYLPNMTMLQEGVGVQDLDPVYWTLWVELHFYALIALLVWRGVTYARCVAFMVAWLIGGQFVQETEFTFLKVLLIPEWAPYFIAGMAFYLMYRFGPNLALTLIALAGWALAVYHRSTTVNPDLKLPPYHQAVIAAGVTLAFLVMWLVATRRLRWLAWRHWVPVGALTYPVYLVHDTIGRVLWEEYRDDLGHWQQLGVSVAVTLTVSILIYRLVEKPVQRLLRPRLKAALEQIRRAEPAADAAPPTLLPHVSAPRRPAPGGPAGPLMAGSDR